MIKVGITGGIGSGKSTVCQIFKILDIPVFEADSVARALQEQDPEVILAIKNLFGNLIYNPEGKLDRKKIAQTVFQNKQLLLSLNNVVHPAVRREFQRWEMANSHFVYGIYEAAILFESGFYKDFDINILVISDIESRINRVIKRDQVTRNDVELRIRNQMDDSEKEKMADYLIYNDNTHFTIQQVINFDLKIKKDGKIW